MTLPAPNRWATLAVLAAAQFVVVLDVTIVNVALPAIQTDLDFSVAGLQWVVSAYTLLFGGFLLLGGRFADLLGRRRVFVAGLLLFGVTSLAGGLAGNAELLVASRAVQGLGAALLSPAALSILTVTFAHGRERNIAMGIWGGLAALGGTLGVVAGGVLVDALSWRWVFFVNVPVVLVLMVLTPRLVPESRVVTVGRREFDLAGALLVTTAALALVLGVIRAESQGWDSPEVIGLLIASVVLTAGFVAVESRTRAPLVPLHLFRSRGLSVSSGSLALGGAMFLSMFFLTAIFLQQARGLTAFETGLAFLPMGVAAIAGAVLASSLVTAIGTRTTQAVAVALSVVGLLLLAQADADSAYVSHLLPGLVLCGVGFVAFSVPAQISATADLTHDTAGAASGVITAGNQIGGAVGLAVVSSLAASHIAQLLASGSSQQAALVGGYQRGLLAVAVFAGANLLLSLASPQLRPTSEQVAEAVAA